MRAIDENGTMNKLKLAAVSCGFLGCSPFAPGTVGTLGGVFLNNDTGEILGMGTLRWIGEGQAGLCGSIVTFDFTGVDGEFTTQIRVGE